MRQFVPLSAVLIVCALTAASGSESRAPYEDPRLNTTVALQFACVPLSDLCQVLERRTGVVHRVADSASGDLLVAVDGKLTLAQLHQALTDVFGIAWRRVGDGQSSQYVAELTPARLAEQAREQAAADAAFRDGIRQLMAAANLPDEAKAKLSPSLQYEVAPGNREAVQLIGDLSPEEQSQILAGGAVVRDLRSLTMEGQARVQAIVDSNQRRLTESSARYLTGGGGPAAGRVFPRAHSLDVQNGAAWKIRIARESRQRLPGVTSFSVWIYGPDEPGIGKALGVRSPTHAQSGASGYRLSISAPAPADRPDASVLPDQYCPQGFRWEEIVRSLQRTLGRPVVSDAYVPAEYVETPPPPAQHGETLEAYLDRISIPSFNRRWGCVGPVLIFQRADWAVERRAQIPDSWVRRWRGEIIRSGRLRIDDLLEMASLSPYQLSNLDSFMGRAADVVLQKKHLLLLWAAMRQADRQRAQAGGVVIRDLPLGVQPKARSLAAAWLGSAAPLLLANVTMKAELSVDAFVFSFLSPGRPAMALRVPLTVPPGLVAYLKNEEDARVAALEANSGPAGTHTPR